MKINQSMEKIIKAIAIGIVMLLLVGCATTANNNFNSTLWIQTASEYKADSLQTYRSASSNVWDAINDKEWTAALEQSGDYSTLPVAIILDIDGTVLDNSNYQANLLKDNSEYDPITWDHWISLRQAIAVPGAVDFINEVQKQGVCIVYITNRECKKREDSELPCPQEDDTIENLKRVGIKIVNPDNVLLKHEVRNWDSEKKNRRELISKRYRIIMLFGDDLSDFLPNVESNITLYERDELVNVHNKKWGKMWFILSNPIYGSWNKVLQEPKNQYLRTY
jgi:5'-nucleotidase (lipoprotein e(P4) family)